MEARYSIATLLIMSAVMLGVLIPGGPVETRSFSQIPSVILVGFNSFLTTLGLGSLVLSYFVLNRHQGGYILSAFCGVACFVVYALDLLGIFPVSPDNMPHLLRMIEVTGVIISIPLVSFSIQSALKPDNAVHSGTGTQELDSKRLIFLIALTAIGIVIFATHAAMR